MEYIVFCDEANKAYEVQRGNVCPACGEVSDDSVSHVIMGVPTEVSRNTRCALFRSFLGACKSTKGDHKCDVFVMKRVLRAN